MPGENIQDWSISATNNGNADSSINWAEGQPRASVNNSARSMMAAHAKDRNLKNGSIATGGSANAQTFFSGLDYTTTPTGLVVRLKIGPALTNTGPCTLNMDNIGQVQIIGNNGLFLTGGELVADSYQDFLWNGTNWVSVHGAIRLQPQTFVVSGTYTPTPGMTHCIIECVGGGGGGGGAACSAGEIIGGAGGGGGAYARKYATAATIGTSQIVTVALGGTGGTSGVSNGTVGGTSSVGALCAAVGGAGANTATYPVTFSGVNGGSAFSCTGDFRASGGCSGGGFVYGSTGAVFNMSSGSGGNSVFGGGGPGVLASNAGSTGQAYGGGGGGACASSTSLTGGAAAGGIVVITEFINS